MSWKNRLMKKEKNKRNKQFGMKCYNKVVTEVANKI